MSRIQLKFYRVDTTTGQLIPFVDEGIKAGFPSPAQSYIEQAIDLNKKLIEHPASTFIACIVGDSMIDEGLHDGDYIIVDKDAEFVSGNLAVCYLNGDFTVKKVEIDKTNEIIWLIPANPSYPRIKVTAHDSFTIWGKVNFVITDKRKAK